MPGTAGGRGARRPSEASMGLSPVWEQEMRPEACGRWRVEREPPAWTWGPQRAALSLNETGRPLRAQGLRHLCETLPGKRVTFEESEL